MKVKSFFTKALTRRTILYTSITLVSVLLVNILVYTYMRTENAIYYWDISAYWKNSIDLLEAFRHSFNSGLSMTLESISSDYNYLPLLPLLPALSFTGTGRTAFILTILNTYLVPFAVITAYASTSIFQVATESKRVIFYTAALLTALFLPATLAPVLDGRVDIISLAVSSLILLLYAKTKFRKYRHYFILGLLICSMFVFRRYYSFWALGFFLSFIGLTLSSEWLKNNKKINIQFWKSIKKPFLGLILAGFTIVAIMLLWFRDIFIRYLTENYSDLYSAYHLGGFGDQIILFMHNFGLLLISVVAVASLISYKKYRSSQAGTIMAFLLLQGLVIFLAFTRTQTFGIHHYYMLTPLFIWSFYILFKYSLDHRKRLYILWTPLLLVLVGSLSLASFTGERSNIKNPTGQLFFGLTRTIAPIVRHDIPEVKALAAYLENTMKPSDYAYVLASSHTFNDDLLRNINLPHQLNINLSGSAHVDKRDGFPNYFFDAQYIVVADPPQTHLEPGSQDVVEHLASRIINGDFENLQRLQSFNLDNNVSVVVYRKTSPYSPQLVESIRLYFQEKYPAYPTLNNIHLLEPVS